jgi:hypothetical protein
MKNANKILLRKPKEKRPLETPRCTQKDNITTDLRYKECKRVNWIQDG